jgi:hypothetical protein
VADCVLNPDQHVDHCFTPNLVLVLHRALSFNSEDNAAPLFLTDEAYDSRFFGSLPKAVIESLERRPYAMENHSSGVLFTV